MPPNQDELDDDPKPVEYKDILQFDGCDSEISDSESESVQNDSINGSDSTDYDTENEIDPEPVPAHLTPIPGQVKIPGQAQKLEVKVSNQTQSTILPLCTVLNARSLYNKVDNFKSLLTQIGPEITLVSETWERQKFDLESLISTRLLKIISHKRQQVGNRQPGGGCAIVYNENKFSVSEIDLFLPEGVEACWALFTPKSSKPNYRVKRIAVGTFYIAPNSKYKTVDHIIESIHIIRAMYDNEIHFLLGGTSIELK